MILGRTRKFDGDVGLSAADNLCGEDADARDVQVDRCARIDRPHIAQESAGLGDVEKHAGKIAFLVAQVVRSVVMHGEALPPARAGHLEGHRPCQGQNDEVEESVDLGDDKACSTALKPVG